MTYYICIDLKVDQALPLDDLIKRDQGLIDMLKGLYCKKWVFTNAYKPVSDNNNEWMGMYLSHISSMHFDV